jgi:zona occludens toxin
MIDLRTGVPGSGKTLSAVEALSKMIARWDKHPDEARPVFVHGVKDLAIPHAVMPMKDVVIGKVPMVVPDWDSMPDGSYCLIDEAQSMFPPRASGSVAPEHVAWLNTHRHHGFDITLITQHPRLIDTAARALVGKHQHYRRLFGRQRAIVYEFDSCSDNLGGLSNAITSYYPYPRKAFEFYKSAEVHTKQTFKLPKWLLLPVVGVVLGIVVMPMAYTRIMGMANPEKARAQIMGAAASAPASSASSVAVSPGLVASAKAIIEPPTYAGCIAMRERCECMGKDGRMVKVDPVACFADVNQSGGHVPYAVEPSREAHQAMSNLAGPVKVASSHSEAPSFRDPPVRGREVQALSSWGR